jgi:hypothetical protein
METGMFVLLFTATGLAAAHYAETPSPERAWGFVALGLLGTLTRPDFGLTFLGETAYVFWRRPEGRRTLTIAFVALYIVPGILVTAWRYSFYNDFVPNAFHRKQASGPNPFGAKYVLRFGLICVLPYLFVALTGLRHVWNRAFDLAVIAAISVALPGAYFTSINPLMGWWYRFLLPALPLVALVAGVAAGASARQHKSVVRTLQAAAIGALVFLMSVHVPIIDDYLSMHVGDRQRMAEVGRRLAPFAATNRWMQYYDVGQVAYESEWNTIDVVGLNTRIENLSSACEMATDLVLRSWTSRPPEPRREIENPCPELYEYLVDLPFFAQPPLLARHMRIFYHKDVTYAPELREALLREWPAPHTRPADWRSRFSARWSWVFGK